MALALLSSSALLVSAGRVWPTRSFCSAFDGHPPKNITSIPINITRNGSSTITPAAVSPNGVSWVATNGQLMALSLDDYANPLLVNLTVPFGSFDGVSIADDDSAFAVLTTDTSDHEKAMAELWQAWPTPNTPAVKVTLDLPASTSTVIFGKALVAESGDVVYVLVRFCALPSCDDKGDNALVAAYIIGSNLTLKWRRMFAGVGLTQGFGLDESSSHGLLIFTGGTLSLLSANDGSTVWTQPNVDGATSNSAVVFAGTSDEFIVVAAADPAYFFSVLSAETGKSLNKVIAGITYQGLGRLLVDGPSGAVYASTGYQIFRFDGAVLTWRKAVGSYALALTCSPAAGYPLIVMGSNYPTAFVSGKDGSVVARSYYNGSPQCSGGVSLGDAAFAATCFGGPSGGQHMVFDYSILHHT